MRAVYGSSCPKDVAIMILYASKPQQGEGTRCRAPPGPRRAGGMVARCPPWHGHPPAGRISGRAAGVPLQVFLVEAVFGGVIHPAAGATRPAVPSHHPEKFCCAVGKQYEQSQKWTASGWRFLHPGSCHGGAGDAGIWISFGPATWLRAETTPTIRNMSVVNI